MGTFQEDFAASAQAQPSEHDVGHTDVTSAGRTVAFYTLGCKLNFSETSAISRIFTENGFRKVGFNEGADVYVINTCSVTDHADRKCKKVVQQALKHSPSAYVAIIGCYAQLKPREIAEIPGVDAVLGAAEKFNLLEHLDDFKKRDTPKVLAGDIEKVNRFVSSFSVGDRTRSFLKVQDGCNYSCSFCTIPLARGHSRSSAIDEIVQNARDIGQQGVKEIVLTGVNIGDFGYDGQNDDKRTRPYGSFLDLIRELDEVEDIARFRISSIEPNLLSNDIIAFVANSKRFVPHFHIPLQSGSNRILKKMQRRYLRELYADRVAEIKALMPHCCIGVDVIVGFPGETDTDFLETYEFLNGLDISYLHVFTYSERDNTKAVRMEGRVPNGKRSERNKILSILSDKKRRAFFQKHMGEQRTVLFEHEQHEAFMYGFTDNYIKVKAQYDPLLTNELHPVQLVQIDADGCVRVQDAASF
ncbi:MAG: tRNA (N(6)-L-threonylcarbamoyladenosine(37)-C(2))-methylthiotransferase MtaB [Bacteroidia bacterium]